MTIQEVKQLKAGDKIGFAGILSTDFREGKFVKVINDYLVEVDYDGKIEHNHITNLFELRPVYVNNKNEVVYG